MKNILAPTYNHLYGLNWVLWYSVSNSYSIVDIAFKKVLDNYFESTSKSNFLESITSKYLADKAEIIFSEIENYINASNIPYETENLPNINFDPAFRKHKKSYGINNKLITVYTDSQLVLKKAHPSLAHFEITSNECSSIVFDIYQVEDHLLLFENESCLLKIPRQDYHFLSGKFIFHLLCEIHNKEESDWLGTFHGSTITDDRTSILFIGESGSGKSTLSSILVSEGFYLLADDVSPMLAEDKSIYYNPNGISIKDSATEVLKPIINNYDDIPIIEFNTSKGPLRYYASAKPPKNSYPCNSIVLVNYSPEAQAELTEVSIKEILETLIPESWLSPHPEHAKTFLDWLGTVKFYKLSYSDNKSMIEQVAKLFEEQS